MQQKVKLISVAAVNINQVTNVSLSALALSQLCVPFSIGHLQHKDMQALLGTLGWEVTVVRVCDDKHEKVERKKGEKKEITEAQLLPVLLLQ